MCVGHESVLRSSWMLFFTQFCVPSRSMIAVGKNGKVPWQMVPDAFVPLSHGPLTILPVFAGFKSRCSQLECYNTGQATATPRTHPLDNNTFANCAKKQPTASRQPENTLDHVCKNCSETTITSLWFINQDLTNPCFCARHYRTVRSHCNMGYYGITPSRCATCAMRSRVLLKDRSCPECKTLLDRLVRRFWGAKRHI